MKTFQIKQILELYSSFSWLYLVRDCFRYLFREYRELTLIAKDEEELEDWRASFLRAGLYIYRCGSSLLYLIW